MPRTLSLMDTTEQLVPHVQSKTDAPLRNWNAVGLLPLCDVHM